jgi:hypothetical protein
MNFLEPTDHELDMLRTLPKRVTNPKAQWRDKPGHRQRNFLLDGGNYRLKYTCGKT